MKQFLRTILDLFRIELADLLFRLKYGDVGGLQRRSRREVLTTIRQLQKLQKQGILVTMATNRIRAKSTPVSAVVTQGGVTAGSTAIVGGVTALSGICGIVESAKDGSNNAVLHTEGVWNITMTVVTGLASGDPIYLATASGAPTQTAAGGKLLGYALLAVALGAGAATFPVKLATN